MFRRVLSRGVAVAGRRGATPQLRLCSGEGVERRELPGGVLCVGKFEDGHIKTGRRVDPDGTRFEGDFKEGVLQRGSVVFADGRRYTGDFSGGAITSGVLEEEDWRYEGEFDVEWRRHGKGKETQAGGGLYEGRFEADQLAEGRVVLPGHGIDFEGKLQDGQFLRGVLRYEGMRYEGPLVNNNPSGDGGRLELPDGSVQTGRFKLGKLDGQGCVILANGAVYEGRFKEGKLPSGSVKWPNGDTYEGELDADLKPSGQGEMHKLKE
eukprot:Hpha_TRINITY_DN29848_c0_g1::TRINITY_DN29848_c0_g1_i1::g.2848::m.2848